jgi:soluble lytic murein transglycosylase-like protein
MPVIQTYEQQVLPQGQLNVQATPEQMGAGIGRAISDLGDTFEKIEQDKGQIWAYKTSSDEYEKLRSRFEEDMNSLDPNDPEFNLKLGNMTGNFQSQIDKTIADLVANAPSSYAARAVEMQMLNNKRSLISAAATQQSNVVAEYTRSQLNDSVLSDQKSVALDPSDENFNRILAARRAMIGQLNNISPAKKAEWIRDTARDLAVVQATTLALKNPTSLLKSIDGEGGKIAAPSVISPDFKSAAAKAGLSSSEEIFAWAIYGQESTYGKANTDKPNYAGAIGPMQIIRETFDGLKAQGLIPADAEFTNKADTMNAGLVLIRQLMKQYNGNIEQAAAAYYSGPKAVNVDGSINTHYRDLKNPNAPTVGEYIAKVKSRMGESGLPQVQMLPDEKIVSSRPQFAGAEFLTPLDLITIARKGEAARGSELATARAEITSAIPDIKTTLLNGESYPGLNDGRFSLGNLVEKFGAESGKQLYDEIEYYKQVGSFAQQMDVMPIAQADQMMSQLEPEAGPGYADKMRAFAAKKEAYQKIDSDRKKDYMDWALTKPSLNVKPLNYTTPDKFRESFVARIPAAIAAQESYYVDANLFSKNEVEMLGEFMNRLNPQDQIAYIGEMKKATIGKDKWFLSAMRQLAPKNTMLAFAATTSTRKGAVETASGKQTGDMVAQYILEGTRILQGRDLGDPTKSGKPLEIRESDFRSYFWSAVGETAFNSPNADMSSRMAEDTYQAAKNYLAAYMFRTGKIKGGIRSKDVADAVKAVTGGVVSMNNSRLFLPWGMPEDTFERTFPSALQTALRESGISGTSLDAPDAYEYANVGEGKYLVMNAGKALRGKNGAVIVDIGPTREELPSFYKQLAPSVVTNGR